MPTYGYQCTKCNHTFEKFQKMSDDPIRGCEKCDGEVRRILYPAGIIFKGSGFHVNDYAKKSNAPESCEGKPESPACAECPAKAGKSE